MFGLKSKSLLYKNLYCLSNTTFDWSHRNAKVIFGKSFFFFFFRLTVEENKGYEVLGVDQRDKM